MSTETQTARVGNHTQQRAALTERIGRQRRHRLIGAAAVVLAFTAYAAHALFVG